MKPFYKLILIVFGIFVTYSCNNDSNPINDKYILHARLSKDPVKLNPILKNASLATSVRQYIMPQICDYNPFTLEHESILLEELPTKTLITEGKHTGMSAINMKIKAEATWDNGSPITAHDYVFTVKTAKHPLVSNTSWKIYLESIKDIRIDPNNNKVFQVIIEGDYYMGLEMVSSLQLFPQYIYDSVHATDKVTIEQLNDIPTIDEVINQDSSLVQFAKDFNSIKFYKNQIISFGPYRLEEWETDQYIRLVKKENFWGATDSSIYLQQNPDEIIFHIIPDEVNAITQLKKLKLDVLTKVPPSTFKELNKDSTNQEKFNFYNIAGMSRYMIGFNHRARHLSDINIRKAISHAIDIDAIIHIIEYGDAIRLNSYFSSKKKTYNQLLHPIAHDLDIARSYLQKSGWTDHNNDGFVDKLIDGRYQNLVINYLSSNSAKSQKIASLVKSQIELSGIEINLQFKPFKQIRNQNLKNHNFDMVLVSTGGVVSYPDPYLMWHSDNNKIAGKNFSGYNNIMADQLIEQIRTNHDKKSQIKQYHELQEVMYNDQALLPLYELKQRIIINKKYKTKCFYKKPGYLLNTFKLTK